MANASDILCLIIVFFVIFALYAFGVALYNQSNTKLYLDCTKACDVDATKINTNMSFCYGACRTIITGKWIKE
jgi:uncharacterized membrane-anchored protein YitT (DUF2179 family)